MKIQKISYSQNYTDFKGLKIDPETNEILKPIRRQLNALISPNSDVVIKKFKGAIGDYTDSGLIINIAKRNITSKNPLKAFINKLSEANYPAVSRTVAKKCVIQEDGKPEILFEADNDLIRTRTYKSMKEAIEEHNTPQYPGLAKYQPLLRKFLLFLSR